MTHLRLSCWYNSGQPAFPDAPDLGPSPHPQEAMKHLGITYRAAHPRPICDDWTFIDCANVPEDLPGWLKPCGLPQYIADAYDVTKSTQKRAQK